MHLRLQAHYSTSVGIDDISFLVAMNADAHSMPHPEVYIGQALKPTEARPTALSPAGPLFQPHAQHALPPHPQQVHGYQATECTAQPSGVGNATFWMHAQQSCDPVQLHQLHNAQVQLPPSAKAAPQPTGRPYFQASVVAAIFCSCICWQLYPWLALGLHRKLVVSAGCVCSISEASPPPRPAV